MRLECELIALNCHWEGLRRDAREKSEHRIAPIFYPVLNEPERAARQIRVRSTLFGIGGLLYVSVRLLGPGRFFLEIVLAMGHGLVL